MEKKTVKKLTITLLLFLILVLTLFFADVYKILNKEKPMFSIQKVVYESSIEYMGLGYKILVKNDKEGNIEKLRFGTIFTVFNIGDEKND